MILGDPEIPSKLRVCLAPAYCSAVIRAALLLSSIGFVTGCGNGISNVAAPQSNPSVPVASALGPQLGYLWLASGQTLRPILGIPGASQIGQSIVPAGVYVNAVTSATSAIAILQGADGSFDLIVLPSGQPVSLGLSLPAGAKLRLSPSGTAALAFTPGANSAALFTGLPASPKLQTVMTTAIADAAVSDTGAVAIESPRGLSVIALNGTPVTLAGIVAPGGISFTPATASSHDDLLFADSAANSLTLVRSATSGPSTQTLATSGLLNSPTAVGVSASGRWALVANSASRTAVRVDLSTLAATSVSCVCQPTLAEPLADDGAFRVTSLSSGPNFLVKAALPTPAILFIPALTTPPASSALMASEVRP